MTFPTPATDKDSYIFGGRPSVPDDVRRAQAGDAGAFEAIYREHSPRVYALCLRLCAGNADDATELMQDAFIRAWRGLAKFRGESAFSSWLHRLTVNAMLEGARSDKRRTARVISMDEPGTEITLVSDEPEMHMDLESAIAALPEGARIAFVLHEIEGYQHSEIAEQLGVAEGTVKSQLHRARKLLIRALNR